MSDPLATSVPTRREVLSGGGVLAAMPTLAALAPRAHAQGQQSIRLALVGAGGRGTGAAANALSSKVVPTQLVAVADVFPDRLANSANQLGRDFGPRAQVPEERRFLGFDAYRKAIDTLGKGDVVILATPPAFRWPMFAYAIEKGVHVFMEKPVSVDGPSSRRMLDLAAKSEAAKLKVGVGLMCRHCDARGELFKRIRGGEIGELLMLRAYRMAGRTAMESSPPKPDNITDLMYQIRRFHSFLWASGGCYSDYLIHNIDECCWMKDAWPVKASATGGRHFRGNSVDQNFDVYSVEYTFADGAKLFLDGRTMPGCHQEFASYAHGTKGSAVISTAGHMPSHAATYKGQTPARKEDVIWTFGKPEPSPYQLEWDHLFQAILNDTPHNEARRGTEASLVTAMGRMAAHTGQIITYDQILAHTHEFAPDVDKLSFDSPAPLQPGADGKYPVPQPGVTRQREF